MTDSQSSKINGTKHFWNKDIMSISNITEIAIKKYIQEQSEESRKEDNEGVSF